MEVTYGFDNMEFPILRLAWLCLGGEIGVLTQGSRKRRALRETGRSLNPA